MTSVYLVRHAQAQGNAANRFQGVTDVPLTPLGLKQAQYVARRFSAIPIAGVYASPLDRAVKTAAAIAGRHGKSPILVPEVIEIDGGEFENKPFSELEKTHPEALRLFLEEPHKFVSLGGEAIRNVYQRMREAIPRLASQNLGRSIVVVSHGCAIRCFLAWACGYNLDGMWQIPFGLNTSVAHIVFDDHFRPDVQYCNDATHLPPKLGSLGENAE